MSKWRLDPGQIEVVDDDLAKVLRRKTPAQKIAMMGAAHRTAKSMLQAAIRRQHPDWDERRIAEEVSRRLLGGAARPS